MQDPDGPKREDLAKKPGKTWEYPLGIKQLCGIGKRQASPNCVTPIVIEIMLVIKTGKGPTMFLQLFSLFVIIPLVELYLLIKVGGIIGAFNTVLVIFITATLGAYLAKSQGFLVLRQIQEATSQGCMPGNELLHGVFVLIGGFALLTPGFLTDAIGLSMLVPKVREIYVSLAKKALRKKLERGDMQMRMYTNIR